VPLAAAVKKASGVAVQAVGMIVSPHQAEAIITGDQADAVYPPQYRRARPKHWPGAALARAQPRGE
jgi:2,4-dienoyl-CoA reductase-like NADH-dependent reductase (Old Yellow Enzyme family)